MKFFATSLLIAAVAAVSGTYDAETRTLNVRVGKQTRYEYTFGAGGAITGLQDLLLNPGQNLIAPSYQGETTDRVIQWTYWNSLYKAFDNPYGSKDCRANVTMEGCYNEEAVAEVISTPSTSTNCNQLTFVSQIEHWFFKNLDSYGTPWMQTTTVYEVLEDGSLKLTRTVLRQAWYLDHIIQTVYTDAGWQDEVVEHTELQAIQYQHRGITSYFEGWSPFKRSVLPTQSSAAGEFTKDGYQFWTVEELGGWAMVSGETQAVAIVFGKTQTGEASSGLNAPNAYFNKMDSGERSDVVTLMPCIESDWPDNSTITQTLVIVPGSPSEVAQRASFLADYVPPPVLTQLAPDSFLQ